MVSCVPPPVGDTHFDRCGTSPSAPPPAVRLAMAAQRDVEHVGSFRC